MEHGIVSVLAKPYKRFLAVFIDYSFLGLMALPVVLLGMERSIDLNISFWVLAIVFLYKIFIYFLIDIAIPAMNHGRTLGRYFMKTRLVQKNGKPLKVYHYFIRASVFITVMVIGDVFQLDIVAYAYVTVICVLSIIFIFVDEYRMSVYDRLSKTMTIDVLPSMCSEVRE